MAQLPPQLAGAAVLALAAAAAAFCCCCCSASAAFDFHEATVDAIQLGFRNGTLTSMQLVRFYLDQITRLNPLLHAVIEVNPDALAQAARASSPSCSGPLHHGVPVLLKDNIATRNRLDTTAGPICRTVSDAVRVLDAIVGYDALDAEATGAASKYIPNGGYGQFLRMDGLKGKRIGTPNGAENAESDRQLQLDMMSSDIHNPLLTIDTMREWESRTGIRASPKMGTDNIGQ
uniref:Amidase domain-containing protein n=1 Tax=Oryza brachyantha TaxID=4533 RepID=J3LVS6_ORYBR